MSSVRLHLSDNFPADIFIEVQIQDDISWEIFIDDVKTTLVQRGLCEDKNEVGTMSINTVNVDGDIDTVIDSVKKLRRHFPNCTPYRDELKMVVSLYDHLPEKLDYGERKAVVEGNFSGCIQPKYSLLTCLSRKNVRST